MISRIIRVAVNITTWEEKEKNKHRTTKNKKNKKNNNDYYNNYNNDVSKKDGNMISLSKTPSTGKVEDPSKVLCCSGEGHQEWDAVFNTTKKPAKFAEPHIRCLITLAMFPKVHVVSV